MNYSATILQEAARNGFRRLERFKKVRRMFIEAYAGQYYNKDHGTLGMEPLNMAFTAVRALVPNIVTRNPRAVVTTKYLMYRDYADLLGLGLDDLSEDIGLPLTLQLGLIDAIFTMGIFKTGWVSSDSLALFGEEWVDPGQLMVDTVDFDNFTFDPITKQLRKAPFLGEKMRVERESVMASGLYDNAIIEKLPSSADMAMHRGIDVRELSSDADMNRRQLSRLHDSIDLLELWLRGPSVLVTLPYISSTGGKFLREETYVGPIEGPYSFLSLTPPVPDNPIPVQLAGVWHDLHIIGNRLAKKTLDQAEAQKDVLGYMPQYADDVRELINTPNLGSVAMSDPNSAKMYSFGGQNPQNERMVAQISQWFDQFSGNTSMLAGTKMDTKVATVANILNENASTGVTYMTDQTYTTSSDILKKCAWFMFNDRLIKRPLIRRDVIPAVYDITDERVQMISPARVEEVQVFLTPEARRGDFPDFAFSIKQGSMAPKNWQAQLQQLEIMSVKIIPAAAAAAQIAAQMGTPFSFRKYVLHAADLMGLEGFDEFFQDPELIAMMAMVAQQGPQPQGNGAASMAAIQQNKGGVTAKTSPPPQTRDRQMAQAGAAQGQADLPIRE